MDILWKTFSLSSAWSYGARSDRRNPHKYGVITLYPPSSCTAAWPRCEARLDHFVREDTGNIARHADERKVCGRQARAAPHATRLLRKPVPEMKDPSGGTTGRVKPYGRLGWMGARAEYSRWGGITAPTSISRSTLAERSKRRAIFLTLCSGRLPENHCAAGYFAAFAADLSDAIDGGESFSARLTEALSADGSSAGVFSPAGLPETEASGTAGAAVAAVTAAKASASPAPN